MWIWLDKTGRVFQTLVHGDAPTVGETNFKIFAYFDGLNPESVNAATIKFRRPDIQGSSYPTLYMAQKDMTYTAMASDGSNCLFKAENNPYRGFVFDFSGFLNGEEIVRLLDTPGIWEATITLLRYPNKVNVTGLIKFYVGPSASDNEDVFELSEDQILENLVLSLNSLNQLSTGYIKVLDTFEADAEAGSLDANIFSVNSIVFSSTAKCFYKISSVTLNPNDENESTVFAEYTKILDFSVKNVEQTDEHFKIYATDGNGAQILLPYATLLVPNSVVLRDEYANVRVPFTPAGNNCATSKKYVDDKVKDALQKSFQKVDVEQYTSLEDFLNSRGEEGYVYLYPVKLSEAPTYESGYYQYIWENSTWVYLGTTQIDTSSFEIKFETLTSHDGVVALVLSKNTDTKVMSDVDITSFAFSIPSNVSQGWVSSCTFKVGDSPITFALNNSSEYTVYYILNGEKISLPDLTIGVPLNSTVEVMAECNGFNIRFYFKAVTD